MEPDSRSCQLASGTRSYFTADGQPILRAGVALAGARHYLGSIQVDHDGRQQTPSKKDDDDEEDSGGGVGGQAQAMTKSMTTIMPIMFGAFSLSFSVGLSIYFVTSNLIGIVQYSPQGRQVLDRIFRKKQKDDVIVDVELEDDEPVKKPRRSRKKKPRKK